MTSEMRIGIEAAREMTLDRLKLLFLERFPDEQISAGSFESDTTLLVSSIRRARGTFGHPARTAQVHRDTGFLIFQ
jgi:hypothetical protein